LILRRALYVIGKLLGAAQADETAQCMEYERWVDNGRIVTSAGVSAGINMSRYVVGKLLGAAQADETAHYMG